MPLELGLFTGCQTYGHGKKKDKSYLILEGVPYSSKEYLSDLAGQDPSPHYGKRDKMIDCFRTWLIANAEDASSIPSSDFIKKKYRLFRKDLSVMCAAVKWNHRKLLFPEFVSLAETWLIANF